MKYLNSKTSQQGVAALPIIMALSVLLLAVGLGITAVSLAENFITLSQKQGVQALVYAQSGAQDALVKIVRNKNFSCTTTDCYTINMAANGCSTSSACATVTVSAGTGAAGDPKIITAKGIVNSNIRKIRINLTYDASTNGEITSYIWNELGN